MPPLAKRKPKCIACNDTGVSSRGGPCDPCVRRAAYARVAQSKAEYDAFILEHNSQPRPPVVVPPMDSSSESDVVERSLFD